MNIVSKRFKDIFLNIICLFIGTIMLYRSYTDSAYPGYTQRRLMMPIFLGTAFGIFLMFKRYKIGFWIFTSLNILVGYWFIFVLEDTWHHHFLPQIVFAALFLPFYGDMKSIGVSAKIRKILGLTGTKLLESTFFVSFLKEVPPLDRTGGMTRLALNFTLIMLGSALTLEYKRLTIEPWPPRSFADAEMHFKYGSIGAEVYGYPYLVWRELPYIFADRIPRGFAEFGFISEPGQELPIGISVRRYGVKRVGFNCATCHTSRVSYGNATKLVLGAPAEQLDLQAYFKFLADTSSDSRLTADSVFESASHNNRPLNFINRLIIKYIVLPKLRVEVAGSRKSVIWLKKRPLHGPGRTDALNFWRVRWGLGPERDDAVGTVDFPSVWNQRIRLQGSFQWDADNSSLDERNISAALAAGTADWLLDRNSIGRVSTWLIDLKSPNFPAPIDQRKAIEGKSVYKREGCDTCHDVAQRQIGRVTPLETVKTDPQRVDIFSEDMVKNFNNLGSGYSWHFHNYRTTGGYVNLPLDGIWARGPYLHNGSVPTLRDLLSPPKERPKRFLRGCTNLDLDAVGFQCATGFEFDTTLTGNSNSGHDYGTSLPAQEKLALLEYLKSL